MSKESYSITVEVRDENGKIINSKVGIHIIKETDIKFDFIVANERELEQRMRGISRTLKAWLPNNYQINISASVFNSISSTYMNMFSFYANENRFVKH